MDPMTGSDFTEEDAKETFDEMSDNFNILMGAKTGKLETPVSIETSFSGTLAEATGSARHVCDFIEEAEHGYEANEEHLQEAKPLPSNEERHRFKITVTSKQDP
jgi:hypothetical protein